MLDAGALIEKHRSKGVLVDANLLVLFLVGRLSRRRILEFKRTQNFTIEDFDPLSNLINWFGKLVATPHVLSQVSDLTDAAIATVCSRGVLVLTADLNLQLALQRRGADALNFNHVRTLGWS